KGLSEGNYLVLVKSLDGSLMSQIGTGDGTGPITIVTTGGSNYLVDIQDSQDQNADTSVPLLKMGDIITSGSSFNLVDTLDYSAFTDCYGQTPPALSDACFKHQGLIDTKTQVFLPDLDDDGKVDGTDYTMLEGNYGHYGVGASDLNRGNDPTKN
ncbi:MAG: hypothetical protein KGJ07_07160, partial [Patescibacteria group bacterium]|nr:hypothetical protein [Patescibacteria group bacterium]